MDKEKFDAVINYFSDLKEPLPTEVKNAIEDVFLENENIEKVVCYYKEELDDLEKALTFKNDVEMYITGENNGITNNIWTYYGGAEYSLSETINLIDKEKDEILEEISKLVNDENTKIDDPNSWNVILHELVEWDSTKGECKRTLTLHIYCPFSEYNEINDDDVEFTKIYQQLRGENG